MVDQITMDSQRIARHLMIEGVDLGRNVVVAGATGLIGRYVVAALQELNRIKGGEEVHVWGISSSPDTSGMSSSSATHLCVDLRDPSLDLRGLPIKASSLIFAAGYGQPGKFMGSPLDPLAVNVTGLRALLGLLEEGARVLYLSSSEVYSGLSEPPYEEWQIGTTDTSHPRAPYIEAKRAGETLVLAAARTGRVRASVARLALAYGPGTRVDDSRVLNDFAREALTRNRIRMRDSGESMRTYCYVADAVDMMFWLMGRSLDGIFNVGGESRISIVDLARSIASLTQCELDVPDTLGGGSPGAPSDVWLSLAKIRASGYDRDLTPMEVGLRDTLTWQKRYLYSRGDGLNT